VMGGLFRVVYFTVRAGVCDTSSLLRGKKAVPYRQCCDY
jgi:hypothetical protein